MSKPLPSHKNLPMNIKQTTPFFMVSDIQRSLQFYVNGLGFRIQNTWEPNGKLTWCWLQRDSASIMLQEYKQTDPRAKESKGLGVAICFQCVDALALYEEFKKNGLTPKEPFVGNNMWDVALTDPDKYNIHFESPTDVPEETKYSDWKKGKKEWHSKPVAEGKYKKKTIPELERPWSLKPFVAKS